MAEDEGVGISESSELAAISPKHMGDRLEIGAAHKRLLLMLPNAKSLPQEVLWTLAQLAVAYRLDPFNGEIYAAQMGYEKVGGVWQEKYGVLIGIKGFRLLAHRQSAYTIAPPRVMEAEEVKSFRREQYDPGDVGVEISLYRLDVARQCKEVGIPYYPTIGRGFYRIKAKAEKDQSGAIKGYKPDNIPETWTAHEVAEKRAEKSAITKCFDLRFDPRLLTDEAEFEERVSSLAVTRGRDTAITQRPLTTYQDEEGEMIYAS